VLRIRIRVRCFLPQGSGIRIREDFFRIPDLASWIPDSPNLPRPKIQFIIIRSLPYIFKILSLNDFNYDLFLHEKGKNIFPPLFVGSGIRIRDKIRSDPDPGYKKMVGSGSGIQKNSRVNWKRSECIVPCHQWKKGAHCHPLGVPASALYQILGTLFFNELTVTINGLDFHKSRIVETFVH
jgi:hypothetical protein